MNDPSDTMNNDINQQLSSMSTPIVATLTTATPITSEIVSDFEPDPKFEITTLEMASYDCQDIYSAANLIGESNSEQLPESISNSEDAHDVGSQQTDNSVPANQGALVEHKEQQEVIEPNASLQQQMQSTNSVEDSESQHNYESKPPFEELEHTSSNKLTGKLDECKSNDARKAVAPILDTSSTHNEPVAQAKTDSTIHSVQHENVEGENSTKAQQKNHFENDTGLPANDHAGKNIDASNSFSMSQTSVDAQMEKVIDNIVELGGIHQFPQSLAHPDGKEEFLASIHREITSERSSIDLIADVASRQKSIEIDPIITPEQNTMSSNDVVLESRQERFIEPQTVSSVTIQNEARSSAGVKVSDNPAGEMVMGDAPTGGKLPSEKLIEETITEEQVSEQMVIEEEVTEEVKFTEEKHDDGRVAKMAMDTKMTGEKVEDENLVEETITEANVARQNDVQPNDIQLECTGVTGKDLQENKDAPTSINEHRENIQTEENKNNAELKESSTIETCEDEHKGKVSEEKSVGIKAEPGQETSQKEQNEKRADEPKIEQKTRPKRTRGKKVEDEVQEEQSSGSRRKRVNDEVKDEPCPTPGRTRGKKVHDELKGDATQQSQASTEGRKNHEVTEDEEPCPAPVLEQPNSDLKESAGDSAEQSTDQTSNDEHVQKTNDTSPSKEEAGRRPRSLRPRESLKRTHVDDTPEDNPPKVEPPKKQLKKSRGSNNDHAPIIKLPNYRSRTTISSSDPVSRLNDKYETTTPIKVVQPETEKKFVCEQCGFATDRINNLVYHYTKSFCKGKCQIGEVMKADIIRQQQQAKNKRRSIR